MTSVTAASRAAARITALTTVLGVGACDQNLPLQPFEAVETPRTPQPIDPGLGREDRNLLQQYAERDPIEPGEAETWQLPFQAKRVAVAMLIAAALDRREDLKLVLTPDATWGLPDRRRIGARPVFGDDDGEAFLDALRKTAARFPADAPWKSQPVLPGVQALYQSGAEPMWTFWASDAEFMVTSMIVVGGAARIDYIGLWEDGPNKNVDTSNWGPPPPMIPTLREDMMVPPDQIPSLP